MKIATGTDLESLRDKLETIEGLLKVDSIIPPKTKAYIEFSNGRNLTGWKLLGDAKNLSTAKASSRGTTEKSFNKALSSIEEQISLFNALDECYVLCHRSTKEYQNPSFDGRGYESTWYKLSLGLPYRLIDGQPVFETETFYVSEAEHRTIMETGLMFAKGDERYPILDSALPSISSLLDASKLIYSLDEKLGVALLFCEKLAATSNGIQFTHRTTESGLKPIVSLIGSKHAKASMLNYVEGAIELIRKFYDVKITSWTASYQGVTFSVALSDNEFLLDYGIDITFSDALGENFRASCYVNYKGEKFTLKTSAVPSKVNVVSMGVELIIPLLTAINESNHAHATYCNASNKSNYKAYVGDAKLAELKSIIGKKRYEKLSDVQEQYTPIEWLDRFAKLEESDLGVYQRRKLNAWRGAIFRDSLDPGNRFCMGGAF